MWPYTMAVKAAALLLVCSIIVPTASGSSLSEIGKYVAIGGAVVIVIGAVVVMASASAPLFSTAAAVSNRGT